MADNNPKAVELLKKALALLEKSADSGVKMPAADDVDDLEKTEIAAIADAFSIGTEDKKASEVKTLVKLAAQIVEGADADDLDEDEVTALCEAVGVSPKKKIVGTVEALKEYFDTVQDSEDGDTSSSEAEAEGEDDDEKKDKGKKGSKAVKEDDDAEADGEAKEDDDAKDENSEEEEEVSEKEQKKRVEAFNEVAKNQVKNYAAIKKLMVGEDGEEAVWGVPYIKGEGEAAEAYCCGLKLKTIPHPDKKKAKAGEEAGKCRITDKLFEQDANGDLTEIESDND